MASTALVVVPVSTPQRLRIGKASYGYIYEKVAGSDGIYKCERGSDWKEAGQVLWLFQLDNGTWQAADGHEGESVTLMVNRIRFSSSENILSEGNHDWTMRMDPQHRLGTFATTLLD